MSGISITYVDPKTLKLAPWNPKDHTDRGLDALDESLSTYGWMEAVVVWKGLVLNGNARLKTALKRKETKIPIIDRSDLTEIEAKAYTLISNRIPQFMVDDERKVYDLAKSIPKEKISSFYTEDELEEKRMYLEELIKLRAQSSREDLTSEVQVKSRSSMMTLTLQLPLSVYDKIGDVLDDWFENTASQHPEIRFIKKRRGGNV
jgi:ParB-like chromosome segregation protein Spo0J